MHHVTVGFFLCFQLSVVEYDPGTHDLQTTSLHFFEEAALKVMRDLVNKTYHHFEIIWERILKIDMRIIPLKIARSPCRLFLKDHMYDRDLTQVTTLP
jgi:hypothetical protein